MVFGNFRVTYADDDSNSGSDSDTDRGAQEDALTQVDVRAGRRSAYRGRRLHFPVNHLQQFYHLPLKAAAHELGICEAALKRICRRNHIKKWPYRQLQSVMRRIEEESRLDMLQHAFEHSCVLRTIPTSSAGFLLPHELESRRKTSVALDEQLAREQRARSVRVQQLEKERQAIIASAHLATSPRAHCHETKGTEDEESQSIIMLDAVSVDDPLNMLASLCVSELSLARGKRLQVHRKSCHPLRDVGDIRSVEILSCMMTKTADDV